MTTIDRPELLEATQRIEAISLPETTIQSAELVPAGPFTPPGATDSIGDLPAFVRVRGVIAPQNNFEVWLPAEGWNERFQGVGNGGLAGVISYAALGLGLRNGYTTASTDTGHVGAMSASWALGRWDLVEDYGHRSIHEMTVKGKAITEAFYGQAPRYSYFLGCSTGGRQAIMEAQRYPEDYDGILGGAPAINISTFHVGQMWASQATLVDPASHIEPAQVETISRAVLDTWDEADGVKDGVLNDPSRVTVDVAAVQKAAGLSDAQAEALRKLYQGPVNRAGESVYPGLQPGSEPFWGLDIAGPKPAHIGPEIYANMVFEDPDWDWKALNYDEDLAAAQAKLGEVMDAMSTDWTAFRDRGGKFILYHGWSDAHISPVATRRYYEDICKAEGGLEKAKEFVRLFLFPGMSHCRGGTGPDVFDGLTALREWVENGVAPEELVASKLEEGKVVRTRPIFPYPQVARWTGKGSFDEAGNFEAATPD